MGTTAQKIQYLDGTKTLLKDTINLTGAGITNDTFRSYANKLKLGLINALNDNGDTIYSNLEKVSGKGSNLSLTPTYEAPMRNREIYGNTLQDGTPTPDTPVPIQSVTGLQNVNVCGKNLFDITKGTNKNTTTIINGDAITITSTNIWAETEYIVNVIPNQVYTFNCNFRNNTGKVKVNFFDGDNDIGGPSSSTSTSGTINKTFTPVNNTIKIQIYSNFSENNVSVSATFENIQLEKNNQSTTYEPYKGNTYEVNLGKNLLNTKDGSYSYGTNSWVVQNHEVKMSASDIAYQGGNIKLTDGTTSRWADGVDNDIAPSGTYTLSVNKTGTITFGSEGFVAFYVKIYNDDGTASFGSTLVIRNNQNEYTQTFTVDSGKHIGEVTIYSQYIQCQDVEFKIQLEKGSTATSYSPYFTPIELNKIGNEDSIKKSTGKNLWNSEMEQGVIDGTTGLPAQSSTRIRSVDFVDVKPNTQYTISVSQSNMQVFIYKYNSDETFIERIPTNWQTLPYSFNTDSATKVKIIIRKTSSADIIPSEVSNIQLEENSQATDYEPYGKVWYKTYNTGEKTFNGSETWETQWNGDNIHGWRTTIPNLKQTTSGSQSSYVISNNYETRTQDENFSTGNYGISNRANQSQIIIKNNDITSQNDFITWLSTHNTTVLYQLATPIYEVITNTELINQLESLYNAKSKNGTTNITITSQDLAMIMGVNVIKGDA